MAQETITVTQLNRAVAQLLERDPFLSRVSVKGEISQAKQYPSGHFYFTMKDEGASVSCVSFRSDFQRFRFVPKVGDKVIVSGRANLYPANGRFQLIVNAIEAEGEGLLWQRFEELKKKLEAQGYFDPAKKKPIPFLPRRIAFVSSAAGAVIHDFVSVLRRRFPGFDLVLVPALVQGEGSAASLVQGLHIADAIPDVEVIVLARGGGSIEDLWSFNEEIVADAIFKLRMPLISAVGHESDVTIADFVADLRAPTPSAAAEVVLPLKTDLYQALDRSQQRLLKAAKTRFERPREQLKSFRRALKLLSQSGLPQERERLNAAQNLLQRLVQQQRNDLALTALKLDMKQARRQLVERYNRDARRLNRLTEQLRDRAANALTPYRHQVKENTQRLLSLSPYNVLKRGYAVLRDSEGQVMRDPAALAAEASYELILEKGPVWVKKDERDE